ncbi:MAG: DUF2760 domain-containing protein [Polyangiaceae bacterium]
MFGGAVDNVPAVSDGELGFGTRLWFAWACFFKVLFDGGFAARAFGVQEVAQLPAAKDDGGLKKAGKRAEKAEKRAAEAEERAVEAEAQIAAAEKRAGDAEARLKTSASKGPDVTAALQLLSLLQREGRFVDFVEQEIAGFGDGDVAAAARVVHSGCRKAVREHVTLEAVRAEDEGAKVTLEDGFDAGSVKLTGNVRGSAPFTGTLRHRGWRAKEAKLPTAAPGHDATVLAPAEVEL